MQQPLPPSQQNSRPSSDGLVHRFAQNIPPMPPQQPYVKQGAVVPSPAPQQVTAPQNIEAPQTNFCQDCPHIKAALKAKRHRRFGLIRNVLSLIGFITVLYLLAIYLIIPLLVQVNTWVMGGAA